MQTAVIILTHGSRRSTFVDDMAELAKFVEFNAKIPVYLAHNEYVEPNWRTLLNDLISKGFRRFVFALAFLGRGNHVIRDIMGALGVSEFNRWVSVKWGTHSVEVYFTKPLSDSYLVRVSFLNRVMRAIAMDEGEELTYSISEPLEIYERSFGKALEIASKRLVNSPDWVREVVASAIYASGNPKLAEVAYVSPNFIDVFREALIVGLPILTDVRMVAAGIRWPRVENYLDDARAVELSRKLGITRAAAAIRLGLDKPKPVVIGNSPTALLEVLRIVNEGVDVPAVIATPPGFANAVEAKEACIRSKVPCITVRGTYGGSNIAVAIANKLIEITVRTHG
jgi:precorrin-8X/cobalt-precorrin-8 methylmutase